MNIKNCCLAQNLKFVIMKSKKLQKIISIKNINFSSMMTSNYVQNYFQKWYNFLRLLMFTIKIITKMNYIFERG